MATWWELTIPAASAIAGSVVTAFTQGMILRRQQRHERRLRFIDEKRSAYARFLMISDRFIVLGQEAYALQQIADSRREELELHKLHVRQKEDGHLSNAELDEARAQIAKLVDDLQEDRMLAERALAKVEAISAESAEYYYNLRLLAPNPVREAAERMRNMKVILEKPDKSLTNELRLAFEEAARNDLL